MPASSARLSARDPAIAAILLTVIQIGLAFIVARGYPRDADEHFAIRGFVRTNAYYANPLPNVLYFRASLEPNHNA